MNPNPLVTSVPMVQTSRGAEAPITDPSFQNHAVNLQPTAPPVATDYTTALINFRNKYEINPRYASMLQKITNYASVIICDDSGSMNEIADPDTGSQLTRWDELKKAVEIIVEAHTVFDIVCDIYFINRGYVRNVHHYSQIQPYLVQQPQGGTNILNILEIIRTNHVGLDMGKPLIVHLLTDGHPTNTAGQEDIAGLANWLRTRPVPTKFPVSIILCTDDEEIEKSYRSLEFNPRALFSQGIPGVDVSEDYRGESRDVKRTRGNTYRFSFGDYIVKVLVGSIDPTVHDIDLPAPCCACIVC
jgi:hypothetical protein